MGCKKISLLTNKPRPSGGALSTEVASMLRTDQGLGVTPPLTLLENGSLAQQCLVSWLRVVENWV